MLTNLRVEADLERLVWKPFLFAHKNRSSAMELSGDHRFLKKTKTNRKPEKRDREFYNLAYWNSVLRMYDDYYETNVHAPIPLASYDEALIMEFSVGLDLTKILTGCSIDSRDISTMINYIGKLFKIKQNEGLIHNDFKFRHLLVNGGLYVIDLENARHEPENVDASIAENLSFLESLLATKRKNVLTAVKEGFESIPNVYLSRDAIDAVASQYGSDADFYLKASNWVDRPK